MNLLTKPLNTINLTLPDHIKTFRLGITGATRGTPFDLFRCRGPFLDMAREDRRLQLVHPTVSLDDSMEDDWHWMLECDAIYMENPILNPHLATILKAKLIGIPVWTDFGDDPFCVRPSNPGYNAFAAKEQTRANVGWIMEHADVVTVPTNSTRESFPEKNRSRVLVIGEACRWKCCTGPRRKIVSWRGMSSHEEDVESVAAQLREVAADPAFSDWQWALFGEPHWRIKEPLSQAVGEPYEGDISKNRRLLIFPCYPDPFLMFEAWKGAAPFLHIVPLKDNGFGRSKPPTAWLEATAVGAATIGPDFPEWNEPGLIRYSTSPIEHNGKEDFATVLRREMAKFETVRSAVDGLPEAGGPGKDGLLPANGLLHPNVAISQAEVFPGRTLRAENRKRWAALRRLIEINEANEPAPARGAARASGMEAQVVK